MSNKYNIEHFYPTHKEYYKIALDEIKLGRKDSHWMWYIFPQLKSLGYSYNAIYYGLKTQRKQNFFMMTVIWGQT